MERSTDVLAAGLLDVSDPGLSNKYFLRQVNLKKIIFKFLSQVLFFSHGKYSIFFVLRAGKMNPKVQMIPS